MVLICPETLVEQEAKREESEDNNEESSELVATETNIESDTSNTNADKTSATVHSPSDLLYCCAKCRKLFRQIDEFWAHTCSLKQKHQTSVVVLGRSNDAASMDTTHEVYSNDSDNYLDDEKPHSGGLCEKEDTASISISSAKQHFGQNEKIPGQAVNDLEPLRSQHICTECSRTFGGVCMLNRHMRIHTGERPYKCEVCQKTFTQSSAMYLHMRKIHPDVAYTHKLSNLSC